MYQPQPYGVYYPPPPACPCARWTIIIVGSILLCVDIIVGLVYAVGAFILPLVAAYAAFYFVNAVIWGVGVTAAGQENETCLLVFAIARSISEVISIGLGITVIVQSQKYGRNFDTDMADDLNKRFGKPTELPALVGVPLGVTMLVLGFLFTAAIVACALVLRDAIIKQKKELEANPPQMQIVQPPPMPMPMMRPMFYAGPPPPMMVGSPAPPPPPNAPPKSAPPPPPKAAPPPPE